MFLGFDLSTQQLKATLTDQNGKILKEDQIVFDSLGFKTKDGVFVEGEQVTSPTLMWIQALETLLEKLSKYLPNVKAISGCGQQHATVYYSKLPELDGSGSLVEIWKDCFSVKNSPIWQDSSTTHICLEMEEFVGSPQELADKTGSSGYERFSASQIAKIAKTKPDQFKETVRIGLASSLIPSILLGKFSSLDPSDASGMNLMDIHTRTWNEDLLNFCHPTLIDKLSPIGKENEILGNIHPYFTKKYGFSSDCVITTFTGDNPASISSCPLLEGDLVISLGTSDTCTFITSTPKPLANVGHVFCNPNDSSTYMAMICFRNGSLARERVRDVYCGGDWEMFNNQIKNTSPNPTQTRFYFFDTEIIPKGVKGEFYFLNRELVTSTEIVDGYHPRLIVESQSLIKYHYTSILGLTPKRIICQGGGSKNREILQIISNVFNAPVFTLKAANGASLGGCYRAMYAVLGGEMKFTEFLEGIHPGFEMAIKQPDLKAYEEYKRTDVKNLISKLISKLE